ncbi:MAG: DUF3299 domain-containing protein [Gammaproteobacteria bacterium]|nr:DUF3299 domain-containing protein [Gammaproteobacteria bacterium]MDH5653711.1 DUF3299 domain-containing protein [Gammaproteobacteria bacterium]
MLKNIILTTLLCLGLAVAIPFMQTTAAEKPKPAAGDTVKEIGWDELIPENWRPNEKLIADYNNGKIGDDDPRIILLKEKIKRLQKLGPPNWKLNGKRIKLPGFVVPLESDGKAISEFLLVPYHGACIHVPPPPANQIVFVKSKNGTKVIRKIMDTVLVTGVMQVEKTNSKVAEAAYILNAEDIVPYE